MLGAYSKGAIGQMVRGPIRPSSYHFFTLRNSSEEYYNLVNLNVGMISITAKEGERINTKKPKNLRIISDGLIGQVFETEI
jgi:hypothetical protein